MSRQIVRYLRKNFYFLEEVAELLGVCRKTVYNWIKSGKIKTYKVGGTVLVEKKAVEALR